MSESNEHTRSADNISQKAIDWTVQNKIETCFDRAEKLKPCPIGDKGACCKNCHMGPCRITAKAPTGVCGADADTIVARGDEILEKPETRDEAINSLMKLSGMQHLVITGVCLSSADKSYCFNKYFL